MEKKELEQREILLEQIEGYFGVMENLHKLGTDELVRIFQTVQIMRNETIKQIISIRNKKK